MLKYRNYIIATVILLVIAGYFFLTSNPGTLRRDVNSFALKDTTGINTLVFVHHSDSLVLSRNSSGWMVNGKYPAKSKVISLLINMLTRLEIGSPVPNSFRDRVMNSFSRNSTQVLIKSENGREKKFWVADDDSLTIGSFIMDKKDVDPYVAHIPGYNGPLSLLFIVNADRWRENFVFRLPDYDILSVEVAYAETPAESFLLDVTNPAKATLNSLTGNRQLKLDKEKLSDYLMRFSQVPYETISYPMSKEIYDSIKSIRPYCTITLKSIDKQLYKVKTYRINLPGLTKEVDLFKMYAVIQNDSLASIVKYSDFDPIMKEFDDFAR